MKAVCIGVIAFVAATLAGVARFLATTTYGLEAVAVFVLLHILLYCAAGLILAALLVLLKRQGRPKEAQDG